MPEHSVEAAAWQTAAAFRRLQLAGRAEGLDPAAWSLLMYLACEGEATKATLTAGLGLQAGSLSNALTRLVDVDLVEAVKAGDRRKAYRLREQGRQRVERLRDRFEEALRAQA